LPSSFAADQPLGKLDRTSSAISPTRQWSMAVIKARSCSLSRSVGLRKKSTRTVARRSRRAARASAFWSAGAAIGHSSGIIASGRIRFLLNSRQLDRPCRAC
jgi:hypothetical protein